MNCCFQKDSRWQQKTPQCDFYTYIHIYFIHIYIYTKTMTKNIRQQPFFQWQRRDNDQITTSSHYTNCKEKRHDENVVYRKILFAKISHNFHWRKKRRWDDEIAFSCMCTIDFCWFCAFNMNYMTRSNMATTGLGRNKWGQI